MQHGTSGSNSVEDQLKGLAEPFQQVLDRGDEAEARAILQAVGKLRSDFHRRFIEKFPPKHLSPQEAVEIMGKDKFFGVEAKEKTWGIRLAPDQVPPIEFSKEELTRAAAMGQRLILRVKTAPDGQPLSMKKMNTLLAKKLQDTKRGKVLFQDKGWKEAEAFFTEDTPELEWALATQGVLTDSKNKNDLEQTQMLADYVKQVFEGMEMPEEYVEALAEFDREKASIEPLFADLDRNWQEAVRRTSELKLNQLCRMLPAAELHDTLDVFCNTEERINEGVYSRSARRSSLGSLVDVGGFGRGGAHVSGSLGYALPRVGVSFSRSRKKL